MTTLFEVSWEVCNKVGGIYTVIRSKIPFIKEHYAQYFLIGPAFERNVEFEEHAPPPEWQAVFQAAIRRGVKCRYGTWLVPGEPVTILIDSKDIVAHKNDIKAQLWENYKIDSLNASWEFEEPMCFATAAGILIEEFTKHTKQQAIVQCHEWIAGFCLLHLHSVKANVGTVFTTHATILGRTIAGNGYPLYDMLDTIAPNDWAYKFNVQEKHLTEVACAHTANVFTTVSDITSLEAEKLLGKKADVILYNGFFTEKFPNFEETSIRHYQTKDALRELVAYSFFPYYNFDLDKTLLFFTSGRYEFQNKGIDVLIDALGAFNQRLKEENSDMTIVVFFWVIMGRNNVRADLVENKNFYQNIKSAVEWQSKALQQKIILDFLGGKSVEDKDSQTNSFIKELREDTRHFRRNGNPPLATHEIPNGDNDAIIYNCKAKGLLNRKEDRVKVVVYPGYLDGSDGILNLQYYDAIVGTHLGIFPSAYEPWGYTPLESAMLGVPSITTDLAGFGRYIDALSGSKKGIFVLNRKGIRREDVIRNLANQLYDFSKLDRSERAQYGFGAQSLATSCSWKNFVKNYIIAHNISIGKK